MAQREVKGLKAEKRCVCASLKLFELDLMTLIGDKSQKDRVHHIFPHFILYDLHNSSWCGHIKCICTAGKPHNLQAMIQLLSLYYTLDSSSDWRLVWRFSIPTGLFMIMALEQRYGLLKCRQINEGSLLEAFQTSQRERLKIRRSCLNSDVRDDF